MAILYIIDKCLLRVNDENGGAFFQVRTLFRPVLYGQRHDGFGVGGQVTGHTQARGRLERLQSGFQ